MDIEQVNQASDFAYKKTAGNRISFQLSAATDYQTSEAFKALRTNILFSGSDIQSILITSSRENEGKSTISMGLSKSLAEIDKKTLLIDGDMRKSAMLLPNKRSNSILGLSEFLSGQAEVSQILFHTQQQNFDIIFSGHFPPNPVELIGSEKFKSMLEYFKKQYDYIIIDSPPLGPVIDAAVIGSVCDSALFVISAGTISSREANAVKNQLLKSGCRLLGAVLNVTEPSRHTRLYKQKNYYYKTNP